MDEGKLKRVQLADLSGLEHEVFTFKPRRIRDPSFLVVRYRGRYRDGGAGRGDAHYIMATTRAAQAAWFAPCLVLDFRELTYHWGDEMEWATSLNRHHAIEWPLRIVVGAGCRAALRSLLGDDYRAYCVETLARAYTACRRQYREQQNQNSQN